MNITVTHTLAPEVINLFKDFFINLKGAPAATASPEPIKKKTPLEAVKETPVVTQHTGDTVTKNVTVEEVRKAVMIKKEAGKNEQLRALLTEFGVKNVTSLEEKNYSAFLEKVNAIQ